MEGNLFVNLAMFGWIPLVLLMFALLETRRAIVMAFVIGWLFLPLAGYTLPGLPNYTKVSATNIGVLLGAMLFDPGRALLFRPRWFDLPMLIWCVTPFFSSMTNNPPLDAYDGVSAVTDHVIVWGIPYLVGRIYFTDLQSMRELALGMTLGALIYVPLIIFEARMSPTLHYWIYGYHQSASWRNVDAFGFFQWQPRVFMANGLALTMFMGGATVAAFWLAWTKSVRTLVGVPLMWFVPVLFFGTILCKAMGGNILMVGGMGILVLSRYLPTRLLLVALLLVSPIYMLARGTGSWAGDFIVDIGKMASEARAQSVETRLKHEDMLVEKAMEQPVFGWGRWGRSRIVDHTGRDISLTDGLWVIALGQTGFVGLIAFTAAMLVPLAVFARRYSPRWWVHPQMAPLAAVAVVLGLYMVDNMFNAFMNPLFVLAAGGLLTASPPVPRAAAQQVQRVRVVGTSVREGRPAAPPIGPQPQG